MKKAVCLLSGGLDSTVSSFIAKEKGYQIYPLSFSYGQRHDKELKAAKVIGRLLSDMNHVFFTLDLSQFGGSFLFKTIEAPLPTKTDVALIGKDIPSTYVPARNTIFLSIALCYAETLDADAIFVGVNAMDYSGYPDCRPDYIKSFQEMADMATKKGVEKRSIHIETPLLHLSKAEIVSLGKELNVPFQHTWSCYRGDQKACGRCDSCLLRLKGFKEAGLADPLIYEMTPSWYTLEHD
jgi:7-cyano-7-deazaguanine synthase